MQPISTENLKKRIESEENITLVEVLAPEKYEDFHLPGAINVPLGDGFEQRIQKAVPDKDANVVVYCWDEDCDALPKAGNRMETVGYTRVRDFEAGKKAWRDAGLPVEGAA